MHNHPSGDPTPSQVDITLTQQIAQAADLFGIVLHDHLILGKETEVSLRAEGYV
ncbi:hypothetical protein DW2_08781 [Thioclava atlantica]|uniref:MPN domain-containing protein n=2 Tax=Thioclava atlantica TaxID=1317124 RepID=A0A085TWF9_9RHOB|nr:JAB domain-containing protein [Thioclava atlantica]KFE35056.1 hypothetical protein DW2_08781 [Thioclava atlantica]